MIHQIHLHTGHSIRMICEVLGLPRSSFYHTGRPTARELSDQEIDERIERIFRHHRGRYGYRRIYRELIDHGIVCSQTRVRRLIAQRGLKAIQPKTFVPQTSDGRASRPSPKLLLEKGAPTRPDVCWARDITFIPTKNGWIYLAVVIDLYSRRIVGWALADHLRADFVTHAFRQAWQTRRPQRSREPIRQPFIPTIAEEGRSHPEHVSTGEPLPQCLDGIIYRHPQERDAPRRMLH